MSYRKFTQPSTRAYATLAVKASDRDDGTIVGIASTPELDRSGDSLLPEGAVFSLPLPLLWQHDHSRPIGNVTSARVTPRGIEIVAKIAVGATDEIDNCYRLIRAGLVRGLSVGFRALEQPEVTRTGLIYRAWELLELSTVTIPCNSSASITAVKAACGLGSVCQSIPLLSARSSSIRVVGGPVKLHGGSVKLHKPGVRLIGRC